MRYELAAAAASQHEVVMAVEVARNMHRTLGARVTMILGGQRPPPRAVVERRATAARREDYLSALGRLPKPRPARWRAIASRPGT